MFKTEKEMKEMQESQSIKERYDALKAFFGKEVVVCKDFATVDFTCDEVYINNITYRWEQLGRGTQDAILRNLEHIQRTRKKSLQVEAEENSEKEMKEMQESQSIQERYAALKKHFGNEVVAIGEVGKFNFATGIYSLPYGEISWTELGAFLQLNILRLVEEIKIERENGSKFVATNTYTVNIPPNMPPNMLKMRESAGEGFVEFVPFKASADSDAIMENFMKDYNNETTQKTNWSVVDFMLMEGMVRALENGNAKYGDGNWREAYKDKKEVLNKILRHIFAILHGEDVDSTSGLNHIDHIQADAMILGLFNQEN
jgi:hypothetical protein